MRGSRYIPPTGFVCLLLAGAAPAQRNAASVLSAQDAPAEAKRAPSLLEGLPGGLILIPEGEVTVGFTADAAAKLMAEEDVKRMRVDKDLIGSVGGLKVRLPAFFISAHEVTNGQYQTFVKATGHRFPYHWWTEDDRKKHEKLFEEATPTEKFDPIQYWEMNWENRKLEWTLPKEAKGGKAMTDNPVEWVSYLDALAYCRWAGLRMPTEAEWIRAARGDSDKLYPWGSNWDSKKACIFRTFTLPVDAPLEGEVAWGAGKIFHMAGNVMEWTSSRYVALPGFDDQYRILSRKVADVLGGAIPLWDASKAVIKGGSYQLPDRAKVFCMIDSRAGVDTDNPLLSAGFRTCKSLWPGLDAFRVAVDLERGALGDKRIDLADEEETNFLGMEAWALQEEKISSYHALGFAPIADYENFGAIKDLKDESIEDPVLVGLLFSTESIQDPELPAGLYLVYYRDDRPSKNVLNKINELKEKQKRAKRAEEPQAPEEEMPDPTVVKLGNLVVPVKNRYFLFRSAETGAWQQPLVQADAVDSRSGSAPRSVLQINRQKEQLVFNAPVRLAKGRSAALFKLRLSMPAGFLDSREWRMPNMLSKDVFGYKKGWQRQLFQVGSGASSSQGAPQPASVSTK